MRDSYELSLWKDIRKGWEEFFLRTSICIGNGRRTRFWWDSSVGESKLKDVYPTLFRLLPTKMLQWQTYEGGKGVEVVVGMFILEDLSKIGS